MGQIVSLPHFGVTPSGKTGQGVGQASKLQPEVVLQGYFDQEGLSGTVFLDFSDSPINWGYFWHSQIPRGLAATIKGIFWLGDLGAAPVVPNPAVKFCLLCCQIV